MIETTVDDWMDLLIFGKPLPEQPEIQIDDVIK